MSASYLHISWPHCSTNLLILKFRWEQNFDISNYIHSSSYIHSLNIHWSFIYSLVIYCTFLHLHSFPKHSLIIDHSFVMCYNSFLLLHSFPKHSFIIHLFYNHILYIHLHTFIHHSSSSPTSVLHKLLFIFSLHIDAIFH